MNKADQLRAIFLILSIAAVVFASVYSSPVERALGLAMAGIFMAMMFMIYSGWNKINEQLEQPFVPQAEKNVVGVHFYENGSIGYTNLSRAMKDRAIINLQKDQYIIERVEGDYFRQGRIY